MLYCGAVCLFNFTQFVILENFISTGLDSVGSERVKPVSKQVPPGVERSLLLANQCGFSGKIVRFPVFQLPKSGTNTVILFDRANVKRSNAKEKLERSSPSLAI